MDNDLAEGLFLSRGEAVLAVSGLRCNPIEAADQMWQ